MSILIVDDTPFMALSLKALLQAAGFPAVETALSARQAFRLLGMEEATPALRQFDAILMDLMMPDIDGIEACRRIKARPELESIPIIMVTGRAEDEDLESAFAAGAVDYITKPVRMVELLSRLRSALARKQELDSHKAREHQLVEVTQQLQEENENLAQLASLDALTGVANRRSFDAFLAQEWKRAARDSNPLSLVMIDIDHFKAFNDCYGHQGGDQCLKKVAGALQDAAKRPGDFVARYGGEEFAIVLPGTDIPGAVCVAETARTAVEQLRIPHDRSSHHQQVTISLGIATLFPERNNTMPDTLIAAADQALYHAKHDGRNRLKVYRRPYDDGAMTPGIAAHSKSLTLSLKS